MEKQHQQGEQPPSYQPQGYGYGAPQAPPGYSQANPQQYPGPPQQPYGGPPQQQSYGGPPQQQYGGAPPPPGYTHQQYPNVVVQQPVIVGPAATGAPPPDHMTAAIFATLCCFWPTGVIAIIKANDAKNAWMRGDAALAHTNARSAKTMVNISIIAGICAFIFVAVIVGVYVGVILNNIDKYDDDYYD